MPSTTMLPFLYQTRTILKPSRVPTAFLRSLHATKRCLNKNEIPFASEVGENDQRESTARGANTTITPTERQIFERIFADIKARGLQSSVPEDASRGGRPTSASRSAMLIMQQAAQDSGQARPATVPAPGLLVGAAKDRNKALLRFPPELRAAASKALNAIDPSARPSGDYGSARKADTAAEERWKAPAHTFMRKFELDSKRQPERMRVEDLITSAKTDRELWDVLEREVFTMPARMGLGKKAEEEGGPASEQATSAPKTTGGEPKAMEPSSDEALALDAEPLLEAEIADEIIEETADEAMDEAEPMDEAEAAEASEAEAAGETTSVDKDASTAEGVNATKNTAPAQDGAKIPIPEEKMSLYIYGPLYPAYLLLALRRLDTAFHTSSPLALNLLPRIKELGLESYVLGVSTPFYNELLDIYWSRYGDLSGMLDLLEEMRHCGLYFDNQTSSILGHAQGTVETLALSERYGSFGAALMTMPQYEPSVRKRIRHWHRIVDMSIQQRGDDLGY